MSRSLPYCLECFEKCLQAQDDALSSTFFILRQTGPTAFVIKEDDERIFKNDDGNDDGSDVEQRSINENDVCSICQEEFLIKKLPITYCRHGCGNNVHVKCMKVWLDHQVSTGEKTVKCPLCRETFGTPEQLKQEFRISGAQQAEKSSIHLGYSCHRCRACPITDKCYKCTICHDYFLCQTCFNLNIHNEHNFDYREKSFQCWKSATREHLNALPSALRQMLANREITENDYDILLQLDNAQNAAIMGIPENVVKSMPTERVHERSRLLQHGEQCRLCLRSYQIGDVVEMENEQREAKRSALVAIRHSTKHVPSSGSSLLSVDMGLSITPNQIRPLNIPTTTDLNQRFRRLHMHAPLRPLIAPTTNEFPSSLEINAYSLGNRQLSMNNEERRQSLLSSPSLVREEIRRVNIEFNQDFTLPPTIIGRRLLERRRSNAK
ncbi:unnamed protein product [Rotaria sordida]|uniref:E3 ubiquitin-protein ligase ZSWIM2 n=1 Tax=Rotaria sordida TaxID=392033 RepID=A0A816CNN8_9BILA|nr:unnamed protein product [Rotaria sordida]